MPKTKPSLALLCGITLVGMVACHQPVESQTPDAASMMRPIGPVLALRMTPYRAKELRFKGGKSVRRVPESHVRWRVESVLHDVLGDKARQLTVRIDGQSATIKGAVPTRWQAADIETGLAGIDVLRGASIEWRVLDPAATRPPEPTVAGEDLHDAGVTPPSP